MIISEDKMRLLSFSSNIVIPKSWPKNVKSRALQIISLGHYTLNHSFSSPPHGQPGEREYSGPTLGWSEAASKIMESDILVMPGE